MNQMNLGQIYEIVGYAVLQMDCEAVGLKGLKS